MCTEARGAQVTAMPISIALLYVEKSPTPYESTKLIDKSRISTRSHSIERNNSSLNPIVYGRRVYVSIMRA